MTTTVIHVCEICHYKHGLDSLKRRGSLVWCPVAKSINEELKQREEQEYWWNSEDDEYISGNKLSIKCLCYIEHLRRRGLIRRKNSKTKRKKIHLDKVICRACVKSFFSWTLHDHKLWWKYRVVRCHLADKNLLSAFCKPPEKCPFFLEHLLVKDTSY